MLTILKSHCLGKNCYNPKNLGAYTVMNVGHIEFLFFGTIEEIQFFGAVQEVPAKKAPPIYPNVLISS